VLSSELEDGFDSAFFLAVATCFASLWFSLDSSAFFAVGFGEGVLLGDLTFDLLSLMGLTSLTAFLALLTSLVGLSAGCCLRFLRVLSMRSLSSAEGERCLCILVFSLEELRLRL